MLAKRQEKEQRILRRRTREMKRLEFGDEYQSSQSEGIDTSDMSSDLDEADYDSSSHGEELNSPSLKEATELFNPLRFLALNLKEMKEKSK